MNYLTRDEGRNLNQLPIRERRAALSAIANGECLPLAPDDLKPDIELLRWKLRVNPPAALGPENPRAQLGQLKLLLKLFADTGFALLDDDGDANHWRTAWAWPNGRLVERTGRRGQARFALYGGGTVCDVEVKLSPLGKRVHAALRVVETRAAKTKAA